MRFLIAMAALTGLGACSGTSAQTVTCQGVTEVSGGAVRTDETRRYRYVPSTKTLSFWSEQEAQWQESSLHQIEVSDTGTVLDWRGYSLHARRVVQFQREPGTISDVEYVEEPSRVSRYQGTCEVG